jgi:nucleoside-diphosphate-sugar epimerase
MLNKALIGYTGFVGQTLLKQTSFEVTYRSTDIQNIEGRVFNAVVCAGAPAQKWLANKEPEQDKANMDKLMSHLTKVKCDKFILISTVDVFKDPTDVDESTEIAIDELHPYGLNRYRLEQFVKDNFDDYLIVRLPGLVGPGLKKNIIFDFQHDNNVKQIESRSVFQFYPMVNLWADIQTAIENNLKLVHLTAEPISVADVSLKGFGKPFTNELANNPVSYNFKTKYAEMFGGESGYQYSSNDTVQAVRSYSQYTILNNEAAD